MLYGAGVPNKEMMKTAAQVGVATVWWQGNPCKYVYVHNPIFVYLELTCIYVKAHIVSIDIMTWTR